MDFRIADTFTDALTRLPAQDQKAVKVSVLDLQLDPTAPGLQLHRIDKSKDPNFWSARVGRDLRLVLHRTASSILVAYVDHHDKAYAWAERRRIEAHPRTGAVQIVEVRERIEEAEPVLARLWTDQEQDAARGEPAHPTLFARLTEDDLLAVGVPADWLFPVQAATESGFFELAEHLPAEAAEALLEYAAGGRLGRPSPAPEVKARLSLFKSPLRQGEFSFSQFEGPLDRAGRQSDPFEHPDARRRFLTVATTDELQAALDAPWDKWSIFLHPSQRAVVERSYTDRRVSRVPQAPARRWSPCTAPCV